MLQTLPTDAALLLDHPETDSLVQFMTVGWSSMVNGALSPRPAEAPDGGAGEHARRMRDIGWELEEESYSDRTQWTLGELQTWAGIGPAAAQAVAALREFGCASPEELRFSTFRHGSAEDPDYIEAELGVLPK